MTELEKQSWEKVRAKGRDRFLLHSIARMALFWGIGGALLELCFWLVLKRETQPLLAIIGTWIGGAFFVGAIWGSSVWAKKESDYKNSQVDETIR